MQKTFIHQKEMHRTFKDFILKNQVKLDAIPVVKEIVELQINKMNKFDSCWDIVIQNSTGTTITKHNTKELSAEILNRINLLFYNYCIKNNMTVQIPNLKGSIPTYLNLSDEKFISKMDYTCTFADELGESLADTAVTPEEVADLKTLRSSYESLAPRPRELKSNIKINNQELKEVAAEILHINKTRLNSVMQSLYESTDDEFYQSYLESTNVEKVGYTKTAVSGKILDKENKQAVPQAHVIIPEANIDHLCQGEKGGFRIKHLDPGTYQIQIQAVTYKTITMELIHRYGETNVLEIEMETEE